MAASVHRRGRAARALAVITTGLLLSVGLMAPSSAAGDPPEAFDDVASVESGVAYALDLASDTVDPEGDPLSFAVVSPPTHGVLTDDCADGACTYTADVGFAGTDSFTWKANDGTQDSNVATFTFDVTTPPAAIESPGPLTGIEISNVLNCSVNHADDSAGEFFGDSACGTFVALGDTVYGPTDIPAGSVGQTAYTPVSQTTNGSGTQADPYQIHTVVNVVSGVDLEQVDSYVVGQESYRTTSTLVNNSGSSVDAVLYKAADCYLQDSDTGYGSYDPSTGAVACVGVDPLGGPGSRIEQFYPLSAGSNYLEDYFSSVWGAVGTGAPLPDQCAQCETDVDNGAGLSWSVSVPAGGQRTRSHLTTFSPLGIGPLSTAKTADQATVTAGGSNGYTITVTNPNTTPVTLTSIVDDLPAGFAYSPGSTTGATTADPTTAGAKLTWDGPFDVPAEGSVDLHFAVTVGETPGTYYNNAGAAAVDLVVVPTGDTAPVTVEAAANAAPVASHDSQSVPAGTTSSLVLPASDDDGDPLTYLVVTQPSHGTLACTGDTCDYTPDAGYFGPDSFTWKANDGTQDSNVATFALDVQPPPGVQNLQVSASGHDGAVLTWDNPDGVEQILVSYDTGAPPASPTDGTSVPITGTPETATVSGLTLGTEYFFSVWAVVNGVLTEAATISFTPFVCPDLTPALDAGALVTGQSWVACAGPNAHRADSTLTTVLPRTGSTQALMTTGDKTVADPPSDDGGEGTTLGTGSRGAFDVSIYRIDLDVPLGATCLTFDYVFASEEYPEYVGSAYNDGFVAQLDQNEWTVGTDSNIAATGNFARLGDGSIISVNGPVFADPALVAGPDTNGTGYDGMSVPLTATTPITPGAHSIYLSIFDAGDSVLDSAVFLDNLRTASGACEEGSNQPPVAVDDTATAPYQTPVDVNVVANDSDADGGTLAVVAHTQAGHGAVSCTPTTCTYTPDAGFSGDDTFTYTLGDGQGGTDVATVTVTVEPSAENHAPVAADDELTTAEDTPSAPLPVLDNDTDADGDALSVTGNTNGEHGTVTCTPTACTYTPDTNFHGADSFTYTVSDGNGDSDTATVSVTVTPVNDTPVAVDDVATTDRDIAKEVSVLANDIDVDGDTLTVTGKTDGEHGNVSCSTTTCTYAPQVGYTGADSFTYTISDGHGGADTATVSMTVLAGADVSVSKAALASPVAVGARGGYEIRVRNGGTAASSPVVLTDNLPEGFRVRNVAGPSCAVAGGRTLTCHLGPIAAGTTVAVTVRGAFIRAGTIANTATVTAANDADESNNSSTVATVVTGRSCTIVGTFGDDRPLLGTNRDDVICGLSGNDKINAKRGDDVVYGNEGNDRINGGPGDDLVNGGPGTDTVSYGSIQHAVRCNLAKGRSTGQGYDRLISIENVLGSSKGDVLIGNAGPNVLSGGAGKDTLKGGAGRDLLKGGRGNDDLHGGPGKDRLRQGPGHGITKQ